LEAFASYEKVNLLMETVYHYASLKHSADEGDSSCADLLIDTSKYNPEEITDIILQELIKKGLIVSSDA